LSNNTLSDSTGKIVASKVFSYCSDKVFGFIGKFQRANGATIILPTSYQINFQGEWA
jgi:hypothetical protein